MVVRACGLGESEVIHHIFGGSDKVEGVVDHHVYCTSAKMRKVVVDGTFGRNSRMWHSHA